MQSHSPTLRVTNGSDDILLRSVTGNAEVELCDVGTIGALLDLRFSVECDLSE